MNFKERRWLGAGVVLGAVIAIAASVMPAQAATGDTISTIIAVRDPASDCKSVDVDGNMAPGKLGTGIAFDGTNLILSCWYTNELTFVNPTTGAFVKRLLVTGGSNFGAMSYDVIGQRLWICNNENDVGVVDLTANTYTVAFTSNGCVDGLAFDASDNTIWASADVASTVNHFQIDGTSIQDFPVNLGGSGNSGLAVGGSNIYLGNDGGSEIFQTPKSFNPAPTVFIDSTKTGGRRVEDLECDNLTFAASGRAAIWSQDAYDNILNAYEIPDGACPFGGGVTTTTTSTTSTTTSTVTTTVVTTTAPPVVAPVAQPVPATPHFTG